MAIVLTLSLFFIKYRIIHDLQLLIKDYTESKTVYSFSSDEIRTASHKGMDAINGFTLNISLYESRVPILILTSLKLYIFNDNIRKT